MRKHTRSDELFTRAQQLIPGGVNSPVRAFKSVGGNPLFIARAQGCKVYDVDDNAYIDYVLSWGPMILGHAHPAVVEAIKKAVENGTSYGAPTALEVELAELVLRLYPSMDKVRFVNSGTEATMSAIRAARAFTKKDKVVKFDGCYHGHADGLLVKAGSGATTLSIPTSPGVPQSFAAATITLPFNDVNAIETVITQQHKEIACIILEPVIGNIGCVLPGEGFLQRLRDLSTRYDIVLIFDEVMTGFRVALGGAQALYGITPDMTSLGKVIGGGLPVGAYGGRREIMALIAPEGAVYQAGTLSGNPIAMTAGIKTLRLLLEDGVYDRLEQTAQALQEGLIDASLRAGTNTKFYRVGTMFCQYFTNEEVFDYDTALKADTQRYGRFFRLMLQEGIYLAPSQFEAGFISLAHSGNDIEETVKAAFKSLKAL
ncbi:glutamate-1-semialdehyde-2,1-aminomutase [Candidatus Magnetobacterium bavaricum]|uniref:Glutamate-1-semialdehyde 2,1-aminomutase n=1 Tax=Candidatus Magnetobacterium bavaricum TaxID=29290 RepID=A0A0F3H0V0_9BACT|nr:glutamate-1-semialdehyde-2,1-aminomutase [Candidatus Magnetobacterium bavaricum]